MTEKHPVHGRIVQSFERPPADLVARLATFGTATLVDAMGGHGFMHHEIKPLLPDYTLAGPALTVLTKPGDVLYCKKAIDLARPGDVIVIDGGGMKDFAVFGDRFAEAFVKRGVKGVVIDGAVRDSAGVIASGLVAYCRGSCIPYLSSVGPGAINVPIICGGTMVSPGDIVIGDRDGIVVVPRSAASQIADLADKHLEGEYDRVAKMEAGLSAEEVYRIGPLLDRWA